MEPWEFLFTTLVATRRCRCLLRSDYGWVVMPVGLRHVISGILAGGISGFRMVLLLLHSPSGIGLVIFWVLPFVFAAIPCRDDTMLSSLAWISLWTGTCHTFVLRFCFVLVFFVCFVLVGLFWLVLGFYLWWLHHGLLACYSSLLMASHQRTAMCMR